MTHVYTSKYGILLYSLFTRGPGKWPHWIYRLYCDCQVYAKLSFTLRLCGHHTLFPALPSFLLLAVLWLSCAVSDGKLSIYEPWNKAGVNIKLFLLKQNSCLQNSCCQASHSLFQHVYICYIFWAIVILLISVLIAGVSSLPISPPHFMMKMTERSFKRWACM